jgi:NADPH2:quinone reductase
MSRIVVTSFGDPADLVVDESPAASAVPGPGEVVIDVRAAGVNFADLLVVTGKYQFAPETPCTPGNEVSGRVTAVGEGVTRVSPGDSVMALLPLGGYTDVAVAPEELTVPVPDGLDPLRAAATPIAYATAHVALVGHGRADTSPNILVFGATGGVGRAAVDVGKRLGATVIAVEHGQPSEDSPADHVLNTKDFPAERLGEQVRRITGGHGADLVVDVVGGPMFAAAKESVAFGGTVLTIGFASGEVPTVTGAELLLGTFGVAGFDLGLYMRDHQDYLASALTDIARWIAEGSLHPRYDAVRPITEAPAVTGDLQQGKSAGKTVLTVDFTKED